MVDPHTDGCLQPEVLAAYVDRGLSLAERARVDSHLASCAQCVALVAGVVRTVADVSAHLPDGVVAAEATPTVARRSIAGVLAAAAAVIAVVAGPSFVRPWLDRDSGLVSLVDSVGEQRSVLGRLTGGFPHAPLGGPSAGGQDGRAAETDRVRLTAGRIRESFGERETPSQLHALGVAHLLAGRHDDAALTLVAASRQQPANAQYLNDVATVRLERARLGLRPDDLPRALAAADRARRLDPSLREAWFNRALAMTAFSVRDTAKAAWRDYLVRDASSAWAAEARTRLNELLKPTVADRWLEIEQRLQGPISLALADEAVRTQTTEARNFVDREILPGWVASIRAGGDGAAQYERLKSMADAFARASGDQFYNDVVATIDRAGATGATALAGAHQTYADASTLYGDDRMTQALPGLMAARAGFERAQSPFASRAGLDIATALYVSGRAPEASELLDHIVRSSEPRQHRQHLARAAWIRGLIAFGQGRLSEAQSRYEEALGGFEQTQDAEQTAAVHVLLATFHNYLGDESTSWRHRLASLPALSITRSARLRYQLLVTAPAAVKADDPEAAAILQAAVSEAAATWGAPGPIAEALALEAEMLHSLGRPADARTALTRAEQMVQRVADGPLKSRLEIRTSAASATLSRSSDPALAAAAATRAIELVEKIGERRRLPQLYLNLAKTNIVWGRLNDAESALTRGLNAFEAERASLTDDGRMSALDESWDLFDASVHLAIKKGDFDRAFTLAEQGRSRTLSESRSGRRSLSETRQALKPGEAIVALSQFDEELAVWFVTRAGVTVRMRPLSRRVATQLVARHQDEIHFGAASPAASGELFDQLLRPFMADLQSVSQLVIVPDAVYQGVGFGGLWDRTSARFVVERHHVAVAPTVSQLLDGWAGPPLGDTSPLVMAGPQARSESLARAVASAYGQADVMLGAAATRDEFIKVAGTRSVVHISSAANDNAAYPMLSRLVLADEDGQPRSGQVFASDIVRQRMPRTRLVVVDNVESADLSEGTVSFARAFLSAGARTVLGTLPGADEDASRQLITDFHRQVSLGAAAREALSTVQRSAIRQNGGRLGAWTALVLYGSDR